MFCCTLLTHTKSYRRLVYAKLAVKAEIRTDAPDGDLDEVRHGAYVVAAPAISTLSTKILINYVLVDQF